MGVMYARTWCGRHYDAWHAHGHPLYEPPPKPIVCAIEDCGRPRFCKGYCESHYGKAHKYGDPLYVHPKYRPRTCTIEGCERRYKVHGWCDPHHKKFLAYGDPLGTPPPRPLRKPCAAGRCDRLAVCKGLCGPHYQRSRPDAVRATSARRRARKLNCEINDLTAAQWREIKAAYRFRCAYCHEKKPLTMDHVIPLVDGGNHTASNVVPACWPCNSRKHTGPPPTYQPLLM